MATNLLIEQMAPFDAGDTTPTRSWLSTGRISRWAEMLRGWTYSWSRWASREPINEFRTGTKAGRVSGDRQETAFGKRDHAPRDWKYLFVHQVARPSSKNKSSCWTRFRWDLQSMLGFVALARAPLCPTNGHGARPWTGPTEAWTAVQWGNFTVLCQTPRVLVNRRVPFLSPCRVSHARQTCKSEKTRNISNAYTYT
ncbi:hypothetical protein VTK26DRAFT_5291 [Humicola hyalothermophila]